MNYLACCLILSFLLLHTVSSHSSILKNVRADDKRAPLRGELVPSSYVHPEHLAYDCFYGVSLMNNCSCSEYQSRIPGCHGPKCLLLEQTTSEYTLKTNFTCTITNNSLSLDCSHNDAKNLFLFSNCKMGTNMTQVVNLYNYEFRFESINAKEQRSIARCPLIRKPNTYLQGYSIQLKVLIHKVRESFISHGYATEIVGCNTAALESTAPLSNFSPFYQYLSITVAPSK